MITGVLSNLTSVFTEVMEWLKTALLSCVDIFYSVDSGLTFLGVLSVIALAISIFFLVVGMIQNFLHLRG